MSAKAIDLAAAESAFGVKLIANGLGTQALHEVVVGYRANRRSGTHQTKTKGTVSYTGKKPYRQKGTGLARAGYYSSPIRTGGGVAHGPHPRDYSKILPRKVRQLALKKALSEAARRGKLFSGSAPALSAPKTKGLTSWLRDNKLGESLLIITREVDQNLLRSARNLPKVTVAPAAEVNAEQVLLPRQVLVCEDALPVLGQRMK
jgi:large subunit ribosomal protein L4